MSQRDTGPGLDWVDRLTRAAPLASSLLHPLTSDLAMGRILKILGITLGALVALVLIVVGSVYLLGTRRMAKTHAPPVEPELALPTDSVSLARGAELAGSLACGDCHGPDLGGRADDAGPFALFAAPNLTSGRGGRGATFTTVDWERAIRHGVKKDGRSLVIMPSEVFGHLTNDDVAALIAHVKRVPPVDREIPPFEVRIVGRLLLGSGQAPLLVAETAPKEPHRVSIPRDSSVERGRYVASIHGCGVCHNPSFSGGETAGGPPGGLPPSNITPEGIGKWSEADFMRAMHEGKRPDGSAISEQMPWKFFGTMGDDDLHALWLFLKTLPPKAYGER
jgi:cytochrome c553